MRAIQKRTFIAGVVGVLMLVLAACQSTTETVVAEHPELGMTQLGEGVAPLSLEPTTWSRAGAVEILGVGMGSRFGVLANPAAIVVPDPASAQGVYLQVILKFSRPDAVVTFEDSGGAVLATVPYADAVLNTTGAYFEHRLAGAQVPADGVILARVNEAGLMGTRSGWWAPRSFVAFVAREDGTPSITSKGGIGYADIFWQDSDLYRVQSYTETLVFDPAGEARGLDIHFALSEVKDDHRVADVVIEVDGDQVFAARYQQSDEHEVIVRRVATTLPAGATTVEITASSPERVRSNGRIVEEGDSFFLAGVSANLTERVPPPPPSDGDGCTPGFWRQPHHFAAWVPTGYAPNDPFDTVFGRSPGDDLTLHEALTARGGGINALLRQAVAALLNAAHPDVAYRYTVAEVISIVQRAIDSGAFESAKDLLESANELGCPLAAPPPPMTPPVTPPPVTPPVTPPPGTPPVEPTPPTPPIPTPPPRGPKV
jgi:hypothetical protein